MPVTNKFLRPILEGRKARVEFGKMSDQDIVDLGDSIREAVGEKEASAFFDATRAFNAGKIKGLDLDFSVMPRKAPPGETFGGGGSGPIGPVSFLGRLAAGETAAQQPFPGLRPLHRALGSAQEAVGRFTNRLVGVPEPSGPSQYVPDVSPPPGGQANVSRIPSMLLQAGPQIALALAKDVTTPLGAALTVGALPGGVAGPARAVARAATTIAETDAAAFTARMAASALKPMGYAGSRAVEFVSGLDPVKYEAAKDAVGRMMAMA